MEYSTRTFNPFDQANIKTQEGKLPKVYIEKDMINDDLGIKGSHLTTMSTSADEQGLTLGTTPTEGTDEPTDEQTD